jgi:integrase
MTVRKRGSGYQADFMLEGQRYRATFDDHKAAQTWEDTCREAHRDGRSLPEAPTDTKRGGGHITTLGELHKLVTELRWEQCKSGKLLSNNAMQFVEMAGKNKPLTEVSSRDFDDFIVHCRKVRNNDNATINRKMSAVIVMLKRAVARDIIPRVPHYEKLKETKASTDFLDFGEEDLILNEIHRRGLVRLARLVTFLIDTGCRVSEALNLDYNRIRGNHILFDGQHQKNGTERRISMTSRVQAVLLQCRQEGLDTEKPFGDIKYEWALSNIKSVYDALPSRYHGFIQPFHIYRHSCASRLAIRGVNAQRIMVWMDHSGLSVTQRYMKLAAQDIDICAEALEEGNDRLRVVK